MKRTVLGVYLFLFSLILPGPLLAQIIQPTPRQVATGTGGTVGYYAATGSLISPSTGVTLGATSILTQKNNVTALSTNTTLGAHNVIFATVGAGGITLTLPSAATTTTGSYRIVIADTGVGNLTLAPNGTDKLNGVNAALTRTGQYNGLEALWLSATDGWYVRQMSVAGGGAGSGTVTNIATTSPITGGPITTTGTIACATCTTNAAALTANLPVIGGGGQAVAVGTRTGNTTAFVTQAGAATSGRCAQYDANGNIAATGSACGSATGLGDPGANGIVVRTASGTSTARTITGSSANQVIVTNGDGVSGNPTLATPQDINTTSAVQFGRIGLGEATPGTNGMYVATGGANNITLMRLKRNTDTSPTGNFVDYQNAAGTGVWTVDITGSLTAGTVPAARTTGLVPSTRTVAAKPLSSDITLASTDLTDGSGLVTLTGTSILTNKQYVQRTLPQTVTANAITPNADTTDIAYLDAIAAGLTINNPTATGSNPVNGQELIFRFRSAAPQTLTFGTAYAGENGLQLPSVTTGDGSTFDNFLFRYNSTSTKWGYVYSTKGVQRGITTLASSSTYLCPADISAQCQMSMTAVSGTLTVPAPSGAPFDGQMLMLLFLCTNNQTFAWNSIFIDSPNITKPNVCPGDISKYTGVGVRYSGGLAKWQVFASN